MNERLTARNVHPSEADDRRAMIGSCRLFVDAEHKLGESPMWCDVNQRFFWVDILGQALWSATESGEEIDHWAFDRQVTSVLPGKNDHLVLLLDDRAIDFDPGTGAVSEGLAKPQEQATTRFNDAKVDTHGALWAGTMRPDGQGNAGSFHRFGRAGKVTWSDGNYSVTNGPAFSPDGEYAYIADSVNRTVFRLSLHPDSGVPYRKQIFLVFDELEGLPDGMTVDTDGNLWIALFGSGRVAVVSRNGSRIRTLALPVPMVTSVCFGGPDMNVLLITTARICMQQSVLECYPKSGSLFLAETEVTGFQQPRLDLHE